MDRRALPDLTAFALLAELRSFRRAGAALGVSASALSHRLRRMETELGVRLLHLAHLGAELPNQGANTIMPFLQQRSGGLLKWLGMAVDRAVDIQTATLDDPDTFPLQVQIQTAERIGWMETAHRLLQFDRYPEA